MPRTQEAHVDLMKDLFLRSELALLTIRQISSPAGPSVTVAFLSGLMEPVDLERFVLQPAASGLPNAAPRDLLHSGRFAAPRLSVAESAQALKQGLVNGLATIHVDGHSGALLVGSNAFAVVRDFGPVLTENAALLRSVLPHPNLRIEMLPEIGGTSKAIAYLAECANPDTVETVKRWAWGLHLRNIEAPWWQAASRAVRLPLYMECAAPAATASAIQMGYIAVLADRLPTALLTPTTLGLLLTGPEVMQQAAWVRSLAAKAATTICFLSLTLDAGYVAITSYHHALLPGPFLVALASSRQNLAFPIAMEILLVSLFDDVMHAGAMRIGSGRSTFAALLGTLLLGMTTIQAGLLGPISVTVSLLAATIRQALPNPAVARVVRIWRYLFIGAAVGLGLYGMALLTFAMIAYLSHERLQGHPFRQQPMEASS